MVRAMSKIVRQSRCVFRRRAPSTIATSGQESVSPIDATGNHQPVGKNSRAAGDSRRNRAGPRIYGRGFAGNALSSTEAPPSMTSPPSQGIISPAFDQTMSPFRSSAAARYRPAHHGAGRAGERARSFFTPFRLLARAFAAAFRQRFGKIHEQYGEP